MSSNFVVTGANRANPVTGVDRVTPIASENRPAGSPHHGGLSAEVAFEAKDTNASLLNSGLEAPRPPRFPWLSRLSTELEPSAKQKPSFRSAPALGDNLDQAA